MGGHHGRAPAGPVGRRAHRRDGGRWPGRSGRPAANVSGRRPGQGRVSEPKASQARTVHEFRVWAPGKGSVDVVTGGREVPMRPRRGGWWASSVNGAGPDTDYSFRVDGGPARPDPRSPFQPEGIDGPPLAGAATGGVGAI